MLDDVTYSEDYIKDNDYTLSIVRKGENSSGSTNFSSSITRSFNFAAQQMTTFTRDITWQDQQLGYHTAGSTAVAATSTVQRFDEFQSQDEIKLMRDKLVAL